MTNPIITIHNAETDEVITREMTAEESAWYKSVNAPYQPTAEETAEATAKAALLEKLGITADEAKLLLG